MYMNLSVASLYLSIALNKISCHQINLQIINNLVYVNIVGGIFVHKKREEIFFRIAPFIINIDY